MTRGIRLAATAVVAIVAGFGAAPALAGDDGAAPLWVGIGSVFGLTNDKQPTIDYREHGKLVLPHDDTLPPPGAAATKEGPNWPRNVEGQISRAEKAKEAEAWRIASDPHLRYYHPFDPHAVVTVRSADNLDVDPDAGEWKPLGNVNPLGWIGGNKSTKLGPEPPRRWLTDPPRGYRGSAEAAPTEALKPHKSVHRRGRRHAKTEAKGVNEAN